MSKEEYVCAAVVEDLRKDVGPIATGIGFLDHMIDQINSHAQIGVSLTRAGEDAAPPPGADSIDDGNAHGDGPHRNRCATDGMDQGGALARVGTAIGAGIRRLLEAAPARGARSAFSCPLDEALVACELTVVSQPGTLVQFTLPPYGAYPPSGRTHIGALETAALERFFACLAEAAGLDISLAKVRGRNAHHIVEAAFKALSRALRNLLDGVSCDAGGAALDGLYGPASANGRASRELHRRDAVSRCTKETSIDVVVTLDGGAAGVQVTSGIRSLDAFFAALARHAGASLALSCRGDLWIDDHHTAEDVAIAVGQCLNGALGTKAGLNRMWCATQRHGAARVQVVMDLSNRPCLGHNLSLARSGEEGLGDLSVEMFEHVLESLVFNARMTVHVVELEAGDLEDLLLATAMAFGEALRYCSMVDLRRAGATASSKGTLSV